MSTPLPPHPSSFRDPAGFVFEKEGIIYRQVNLVFKEQFDQLMNSGCYKHLVQHGLLIPHEVVSSINSDDPDHYLTLRPEPIPFISYPSEWCFDMLKDAALLTLQLVRESLHYGMILKDATPFNIQWYKGRLIFIDTLSFEKYEQTPWIAYRQFCENFLAPLLLMHHRKFPIQPMLLGWPEGIPLQLASTLLPRKTRFSLHTYLHIHLHAKMSAKPSTGKQRQAVFSQQKLLNLLSSLESLVSGLKFADNNNSTWSGYYEEAAQRNNYLADKKAIIADWLKELKGLTSGADLGANEGEFSQLLANNNIPVISADFDPYCINRLYKKIRQDGERGIQPLIIDLSNPTPSFGLNNEERTSFLKRLDVDIVFALALVHHLAIGKNISFNKIASLFEQTGKWLIIEFVPKTDEKVQQLLLNKKDIYPAYTEQHFLSSFSKSFELDKRADIPGSGRTLFLMKRKD